MSDCLFCNIAAGKIDSDIVLEEENAVAFRDINPQAPTHILVIPRKHIARISEAEDTDQELLGELILLARKIADDEGISEDGYRLVFNNGAHGGQAVEHIHLHLLGGRQLTWPPG
ncbi:MAG: histidine triad nucleotide-binding protein [Candidatus Marinimicrobia bacterium]|nr:histidine triad nucleotide-binding protein [Candidatus Neomarinimicrobiota bacterium]MCF7880267.1 histidine triad nucleotide-binding protein [Candidatus Neomarinimicrobiota bacterium]